MPALAKLLWDVHHLGVAAAEFCGCSPQADTIRASIRKSNICCSHYPNPNLPRRHTTASEHVRAANDAEFKVLNEAYQALMDGGAWLVCGVLCVGGQVDVLTCMARSRPVVLRHAQLFSHLCGSDADTVATCPPVLAIRTLQTCTATSGSAVRPVGLPATAGVRTRAATAVAAMQGRRRAGHTTLTMTRFSRTTALAPAEATGGTSSTHGGLAWVSSVQQPLYCSYTVL